MRKTTIPAFCNAAKVGHRLETDIPKPAHQQADVAFKIVFFTKKKKERVIVFSENFFFWRS